MLTLADEQSELLSLDKLLREAVYLVSVQEGRVMQQRARGLNSELSEALLSQMNATLRNFIRHRRAIARQSK